MDVRAESGLSLSVEVASAYVFRGLNIYGRSQGDQRYRFSPSVTYEFGETGFWANAWGAFLAGGSATERVALVKDGTAHELNLSVGYELEIREDQLSLDFILMSYLYPFASRDEAGTHFPAYLEPAVELRYSGPVDVAVKLAYSVGLQAAVSDLRYLYLRPRAGKRFALNAWCALLAQVEVGYKLFHHLDPWGSNALHIQVDWALEVNVGRGFLLRPGVHAAWTNLAGRAVGDEHVIWWGVYSEYAP